MREIVGTMALLLGSFVALPGDAATIPAITISNTTGIPSNSDFTLGWEFTTNQQITVSEVGLFDDNQNGLVDSYQIGIWNSSGTLLGGATVLSGTADPLIDQFRYASLNGGPIVLASGQTYEIGALFLDQNDTVIGGGNATNFASDPSITFDRSTYAIGSTLTKLNISIYTQPGYFGPNFLISATSTVPEPSTLLLLTCGLLGMDRLIRRKSKY